MLEKENSKPLLDDENNASSTRKEKIDLPVRSALVAYMFTLNMLAYACYAVIAPFMPLELEAKGI